MTKKILLYSFGILIMGALVFYLVNKNTKDLYQFESIKKGSIVQAVYGIGVLTSRQSFNLKTGVTSTVKKLFVEEGQSVIKNQKLILLDGLYEYKAPFSGRVVFLPFREGETVYAQTLILSLVDPFDTYLLVSVEQQGALNLKKDLNVKINFDGLRNQNYSGLIESVYSNGSDFMAKISIDQLPRNLLPGMTADVAIIIQEKKDVILVPISALENETVTLYKNKKIIHTTLKTGLIDDLYAEVISGDIHEGDLSATLKPINP